MTAAAIEAGAKAWFDRLQAGRLDAGRKRPDGVLWHWDDLPETDRRAYRALVAPVVVAALTTTTDAGTCSGDNKGASE